MQVKFPAPGRLLIGGGVIAGVLSSLSVCRHPALQGVRFFVSHFQAL